MKINLALYIFLDLVRVQNHQQGRSVHLSEYRAIHDIPESTFYRHVNSLIESGLIIRISRDSYSVSHELMREMKPLSELFLLQSKMF